MKRRDFVWMNLLGWEGVMAARAYAGLNCDLCKQAIEGQYFEFKDQYLHIRVCQSCNRSQPRCDACNIPALPNQLTSSHGERLCASCLRTARYCNLCRKRIEGQYFQVKGGEAMYCARCYKSYPKCKICGLPKAAAEMNLATQICRTCQPNVKYCAACNEAITGTYFTYEFSDSMFCENCHAHRPKCYVCGVPVGKQYWKYPDGRSVCLACNERAIIDPEKIKQIAAEVRGLMERHLKMKIEHAFDLQVQALNNNSFLSTKQERMGIKEGSVLHGKELGLYRLANGKSEIFLLYGLPIELIYETAAHELAHAWQAENVNMDQSLEKKEGFAQWVAAQVLKLKGYKQALEKLESRDDRPYGTGYRIFKNVEQNLGKELVLEFAKK